MRGLAEFYAARLDEEAAAAGAAYGFWRAAANGNIIDNSYAAYVAVGPGGKGIDDASRAHILMHAPEAACRGIAADRAILARYEVLRHPSSLWERILFPALAEMVLACIRDRAARFSGHPDYKAKWRPR